jgi:CBS domain-containing protein
MLTVRQLLKSKGDLRDASFTVSPDDTVMDALKLMKTHNIGAVMITERDMLVGIFSERDYARRGAVMGESCENKLIRDVMTPKVFFIHPDKTIEDCMFLMTAKHIRHLPVMENQRLIGMITIRDAVKAIISEKENKIRELESYITGAYGVY